MSEPRSHSTIKPPHLTQEQRIKFRDEIALRVLPFCCMELEHDPEYSSLNAKATRAAQRAYVIADAVLAARSMAS